MNIKMDFWGLAFVLVLGITTVPDALAYNQQARNFTIIDTNPADGTYTISWAGYDSSYLLNEYRIENGSKKHVSTTLHYMSGGKASVVKKKVGADLNFKYEYFVSCPGFCPPTPRIRIVVYEPKYAATDVLNVAAQKYGCWYDEPPIAPGTFCYTRTIDYGDLYIFLSQDNKLNDPVIVVEPLQVLDVREAPHELVMQMDSKPLADGSPYSKSNLFSRLRLGDGGQGGQDVILFSYNDSEDSVLQHSEGLRLAIAMVNARKVAGARRSAVIGLSMGGVVARHALAKMEATNGQNHDASLYISFDAPHQGANVSSSVINNLLELRRRINDICDVPIIGSTSPCSDGMKAINAAVAPLESPAAKELLVHYNSSAERKKLVSELNKYGFPRDTFNVAFSNGSSFSSSRPISANAVAHDFTFDRPSPWTDKQFVIRYATPGSIDTLEGSWLQQSVSSLIGTTIKNNGMFKFRTFNGTNGWEPSFIPTFSAFAASQDNPVASPFDVVEYSTRSGGNSAVHLAVSTSAANALLHYVRTRD